VNARDLKKLIEQAALDSINVSGELRGIIEDIPEQVLDTVKMIMQADSDTGEAKDSIGLKSRRNAYKKLSYRRVRVGTVESDLEPGHIGALEFGRGADQEQGETPEFAQFRRAAAIWQDAEFK